jgi:DNA primase
LKRYTKQVVVLFDGDEAGQMAARRSLPILLQEGLYPKGLFLPDNQDPDDFLKANGGEALKARIEGAHDLYDVILEEEVRHHRGEASEKIQILDRLAEILKAVPDARLRNLYIQNTSMHLDVDAKLVQASLKAAAPRTYSQVAENTTETPEAPAPTRIEVHKPPPVEQELLNVALLKEVYLKEVMSSGVLEEVSDPGLKKVFERLTQLYRQMPNKFDNLSALLTPEVKPTNVVTMFLSEPYRSLSTEAAEKLIHDCIKRIKENFMKQQMKELMTDLRGAHGPDQKKKLEQIMNIHRSRRQLNKDN